MSAMRDGLEYRVFYTDPVSSTYRIGARISQREPIHGGNVHWLEELFDTREEAQTALDAMQAAKGRV